MVYLHKLLKKNLFAFAKQVKKILFSKFYKAFASRLNQRYKCNIHKNIKKEKKNERF